jgi:hypothetical protein
VLLQVLAVSLCAGIGAMGAFAAAASFEWLEPGRWDGTSRDATLAAGPGAGSQGDRAALHAWDVPVAPASVAPARRFVAAPPTTARPDEPQSAPLATTLDLQSVERVTSTSPLPVSARNRTSERASGGTAEAVRAAAFLALASGRRAAAEWLRNGGGGTAAALLLIAALLTAALGLVVRCCCVAGDDENDDARRTLTPRGTPTKRRGVADPLPGYPRGSLASLLTPRSGQSPAGAPPCRRNDMDENLLDGSPAAFRTNADGYVALRGTV